MSVTAIETAIDTVVVGGGQAGIALSEHLSDAGVPHLVLERGRIAERWRSWRWDSLVTNGPAWHDRFPGLEFDGVGPDAFVPKEQVADYFESYAQKIGAPIHTGVEVTSVQRNAGRPGFTVETSAGIVEAHRVVAATGPFQRPNIPAIVPGSETINQLHSSDYRNPEQLSEGAVLVVGAGSSGVQIADELNRAGRKVYLSVGAHDRPPRSYRGRDYDWWLGVLGLWDLEATPEMEHVTIAVSGALGGRTIDFRQLAHEGIVLVGLTKSFDGGWMKFEPGLADNIARGDANYLSLLDAADAYIEHNGLDLPEEPEARRMPAAPSCIQKPILDLDLAKAGVTSILWATGFGLNYGWLNVKAFDENGQPRHRHGVSAEPGVYFLGLPWLSCRGSSFIWGVWHDAKYIADHISKQRRYLLYHLDARRRCDADYSGKDPSWD